MITACIPASFAASLTVHLLADHVVPGLVSLCWHRASPPTDSCIITNDGQEQASRVGKVANGQLEVSK